MAVPLGNLPTPNLPHPCSRDNSAANPDETQDPPRMRFAVLLELAKTKLKITYYSFNILQNSCVRRSRTQFLSTVLCWVRVSHSGKI